MTTHQLLREEWYCCGNVRLTPTETIRHIEEQHAPVAVENHEYKCQRCLETYADRVEAVVHFLVSHTPYHFRCLQCMGGFLYFGAYLEHIEQCNQYIEEVRNRQETLTKLSNSLTPFREPH